MKELRITMQPGTVTSSRDNTTVSFRAERGKTKELGEGGGCNVSIVLGEGSKVNIDPQKDYDIVLVEREKTPSTPDS